MHTKDKAVEYVQIKRNINKKWEGQVYPRTKVKFKRVYIDYHDGRHITGVFPTFASKVDIKLPEELWKASFDEQKTYLKKEMQRRIFAIEEGERMAKMFTEEELERIKQGKKLENYTWHHNQEEGLMQLVDKGIHAKVRHTGGMSIWGCGHRKKQEI